MCGRFVIELTPNLVKKVFGLTDIPDLPPRYNVAPTQSVPVIREASDGSRRLSLMRWGLVPSWSKEIGEGLINARSETVHACGGLTDQILDRAIDVGARVAVLPCCHDLDNADLGGLEG